MFPVTRIIFIVCISVVLLAGIVLVTFEEYKQDKSDTASQLHLPMDNGWFCHPDIFDHYYDNIMKNDNVFDAQITDTDVISDTDYGTVSFQTTKIYKGDFRKDWSLNVSTLLVLDGPLIFVGYADQFTNDPKKKYLFASNKNLTPFPIGCDADEFIKFHSSED